MKTKNSKLFAALLNISQAALDLVNDSVDLIVSENKIYFQSKSSGYCIAVIPDESGAYQGRRGQHAYFSDSLDEYSLCDLLENCERKGFDSVFIHAQGVN